MDLTSNHPFWPIRDGLIHTYPRLDGDAECDIVVLGGGITGALVAFHLVEAGFDTMVLDKREVGWGSTSASTAVLQYEIDVLLVDLAKLTGQRDAERAYVACKEAVDKLADLAARLSEPTSFTRKKSLYLAGRKRDVKTLRAELEMRQSIGIAVDWLDEAQITERFSFSRPGALLSEVAAQMDPFAMAHALLHDASARGLRVHDRTNVTKVDAREDGVTLRTADDCVVRAKHLVFATGYETHEFLKQKVAKLVSTYALVSEPVASFAGWGEEQCVIWEHARPYLYLRTTSDGRVLVGGEDAGFKNADRRDRLLSKKTDRLASRFREMFPHIPFEVAFSWAGTFGETKDGLACLGQHRDWPRSWFALGYGGNGITYSLLAAEIIRDAMLGVANENADLFRFDRKSL